MVHIFTMCAGLVPIVSAVPYLIPLAAPTNDLAKARVNDVVRNPLRVLHFMHIMHTYGRRHYGRRRSLFNQYSGERRGIKSHSHRLFSVRKQICIRNTKSKICHGDPFCVRTNVELLFIFFFAGIVG